MLTRGLRGQASSVAGAWQLEDNGYVLPRPRATAGPVPLGAAQPSVVSGPAERRRRLGLQLAGPSTAQSG
jgi:hypothetical protein